MTLWQQLQAVIERANTIRVSGVADDDLLRSVRDLSAREGHQPDEMILILLDQAVKNRRQMDRAHRSWDALSPREKQVAALVCTGLTWPFLAPRAVPTAHRLGFQPMVERKMVSSEESKIDVRAGKIAAGQFLISIKNTSWIDKRTRTAVCSSRRFWIRSIMFFSLSNTVENRFILH